MVNQEKIIQVDDCSYPFRTQFGHKRTEDSGEDSRNQRKARWKTKERVRYSFELKTKLFRRLLVYRDCIEGVIEVAFYHIIAPA